MNRTFYGGGSGDRTPSLVGSRSMSESSIVGLQRPTTTPNQADGKKRNERTSGLVQVNHKVSPGKISNILGQLSTLRKLKRHGLRKHNRDCELFDRDRRRVELAVADLLVALDFKFFEKLSLSQLEAVVAVMNVEKYMPGEYVFKKGTHGTSFYSLFVGTVDIVAQEGARPVATLHPGQTFGELALVSDDPRAASIRARSQVLVGVIKRADFAHIRNEQRAISEAVCYSTVNYTVPFCIYTVKFKRQLAQIMEQRRVMSGREVSEGSNLANELIITRKGTFEVSADIRLNMASDLSRAGLSSAAAAAALLQAPRTEKFFHDIPLYKFETKGRVFGLGAVLYGINTPGVRDWVMDATFLKLRMITRSEEGAHAFTIAKGKFNALLRNYVEMKRWCERMHHLQFRFEQNYMSRICLILNKQDFGMKKSFYMNQIHDIVNNSFTEFEGQVDWKYFLEDIRRMGQEKEAIQKSSMQKTLSAAEYERMYPDETRRETTWDYI